MCRFIQSLQIFYSSGTVFESGRECLETILVSVAELQEQLESVYFVSQDLQDIYEQEEIRYWEVEYNRTIWKRDILVQRQQETVDRLYQIWNIELEFHESKGVGGKD